MGEKTHNDREILSVINMDVDIYLLENNRPQEFYNLSLYIAHMLLESC